MNACAFRSASQSEKISFRSAVFVTSRANVVSLALSNATLFTADGDSSVEAFNISIPSIPNGVGAIASQRSGDDLRKFGSHLRLFMDGRHSSDADNRRQRDASADDD